MKKVANFCALFSNFFPGVLEEEGMGLSISNGLFGIMPQCGTSFSPLIAAASNNPIDRFLPETSNLYAWLGVGLTVESIVRTYARFTRKVGPKEALRWFQSQGPAAQGAHPALIQIFAEEAPRWSRNLESAYGMGVRFEGLELLDQMASGALVMCAAIHHASLEPCFTIWKDLPQVRPVPEASNYLKSPFARRSGLGALLAGAGFVFTERPKESASMEEIATSAKLLRERLEGIMVNHGLWPLFFITAGRPPVAFNDDGSIAPPGLFLRGVDREKPAKYYVSGVISTAKMIAKRAKRPIFIPLIVTEGEHLVKPKVAKNAPFIEPVTRGQTVTHRIVACLDMLPGRSDPRIMTPGSDGDISVSQVKFRRLEAEMIRIFKKVTGIEDYLVQIVGEWGERHEMINAADSFAEQAKADERLFITADRIRALHPRLTPINLREEVLKINDWDYPFRSAAQRDLLTLLDRPDPKKLEHTLGAVTALVGAAEYRDWRKVR